MAIQRVDLHLDQRCVVDDRNLEKALALSFYQPCTDCFSAAMILGRDHRFAETGLPLMQPG